MPFCLAPHGASSKGRTVLLFSFQDMKRAMQGREIKCTNIELLHVSNLIEYENVRILLFLSRTYALLVIYATDSISCQSSHYLNFIQCVNEAI